MPLCRMSDAGFLRAAFSSVRFLPAVITRASRVVLGGVLVLLLCSARGELLPSARAQEEKPPKIEGHWGEDAIGFRWTEQDSVDGRWQLTDVGPFLGATVEVAGRMVPKGLVVRVPGTRDVLLFDTATGTWEAWWRGDALLQFDPARFGLIRLPMPSGPTLWDRGVKATSEVAGYRHRALRLHGNRVLLSGEHAGVQRWETSSSLGGEAFLGIVRELRFGLVSEAMTIDLGLPVMELEAWQTKAGRRVAKGKVADREVVLVWEGEGATLRGDGLVELSPAEQGTWLRLAMAVADEQRPVPDVDAVLAALDQTEPAEWERWLEPGEMLWKEVLKTSGTLGEVRRGLRMDEIALPFENPYRALMFLSGVDFFADGSAAISTVHGDVWRVRGLEGDLSEVSWRRYATGLFQPLGLKIVDEEVFVLGRDQITRLKDRDGNDEADEYEVFFNGFETSTGTHDYAACLERDSAGNFWSVRANTGVERIAADGSRMKVVATGLRNPNGLGMGPGDVVTTSPQEGEWTPASSVIVVREGGHYGYRGPQPSAERPEGYDSPMVWLPRLLDNSSGGQVWLPEQGWGSLNGGLVHLSFGRCWPILILPERGEMPWQGAAVRLPFESRSGLCRGRVQPTTGALFLAGLKGWASSSVLDGSLHRMVPVEEDPALPVGIETLANGVVIRFGRELDRDAAQDVGRWSAQAWNYRYSAEYGSADYKVSRPAQPGHDEVEIRSVTLLDDGSSVFVEIPKLAPVMQLALTYELLDREEGRLADTLYQTIHRLGSRAGVPGPHAVDRVASVDVERLSPGIGLRLSQQRLDGTTVVDTRAVRSVVLSREGKPISPWIESRPFTAAFEGWLRMEGRTEVSFEIVGDPAVTMELEGNAIPVAESDAGGVRFAPVTLERGVNALRVVWDSFGEGASRIELRWRGEDFESETISPERWLYDPLDPRWAAGRHRREARLDVARHHCHRCHALPDSRVTASEMPIAATLNASMLEWEFTPPDLIDITQRRRADWLEQWILDPAAMDAATEMPALLDASRAEDRQTAADLVAYLREQTGEAANEAATEVNDAEELERIRDGAALFEMIGCIACHIVGEVVPDVTGPDETRRSLSGVSKRFEREMLETFLADPTAHHAASRMPRFETSEAERAALAAYLLDATGREVQESERLEGDAARGRLAFTELGCAQCHALQAGDKDRLPASDLRGLAQLRLDRGCLSDAATSDTGKRVPRFGFTEAERGAIREWLMEGVATARVDVAQEIAERWIQELRCQACHDRDGVAGDLGQILFDESEEGLSPEWLPSLTWTGEKLHEDWLRGFLSGESKTVLRPWLRARMPVFGVRAEGLAAGLVEAHGAVTDERGQIDPERVELGRRLIGAVEGFDCRQCHGLGGLPATGDAKTQVALGIDFEQAGRRLRSEYYQRWMRDPLRIDPLTKMPRYSEDRRTTKIDGILGGDARLQFEAIEHFLRAVGSERLE